ncbi:MAG: SDR family oxidoreductase [Candidatus Tectomicrobia bacterium]|uniref:SDR family oxidoreductase n=1 Tax=Tectimicrobiota bacterium TaxID=2528274 RepID=A0A932FXC7_UNCTE|nr:SDR family oxidoreductase [Candidatus Tectomicrobia bacterium]
MLLENKVAIVTGAGRGIGRACAIALAQEGAKVVVNDYGVSVDGREPSSGPAQQVADEIREGGGTAVANLDTVATAEGGQRIIQSALDHFGKLDILVTPAGILRDRMIFNMTEEEWDAVIAVHLKGHFTVIRPAASIMRQQRSGRIITFTSAAGLRGNPGQPNYSAAKAGIAGLTRCIAQELAKYNITVNCISPGAYTRMVATIPERSSLHAEGPQAAEEIRTLGGPEDIAPAVVFLASDEAQDINGQIVHIAGDQLGLWSHPQLIKSAFMPGGWTLDKIRQQFRSTVGSELQKVGLF